MPGLLLDRSALSDFLEQREPAASRVRERLRRDGHIVLSVLSWYEIERGLRAIDATQRRREFERLCRDNVLLAVDKGCLGIAADIWVALRSAGRAVNEVDVIIAASALEHDMVVATCDADFEGIAAVVGLAIERWR